LGRVRPGLLIPSERREHYRKLIRSVFYRQKEFLKPSMPIRLAQARLDQAIGTEVCPQNRPYGSVNGSSCHIYPLIRALPLLEILPRHRTNSAVSFFFLCITKRISSFGSGRYFTVPSQACQRFAPSLSGDPSLAPTRQGYSLIGKPWEFLQAPLPSLTCYLLLVP
jgi:hypothetical protein